jgi:hypothetical protein
MRTTTKNPIIFSPIKASDIPTKGNPRNALQKSVRDFYESDFEAVLVSIDSYSTVYSACAAFRKAIKAEGPVGFVKAFTRREKLYIAKVSVL